ncbi:hypothetical protein PR202_gb23689 [Eleusine coracana subsp. coracana]|uniref:Disease resistance protein RPM1 n=1 Tax=Eleusine coracana subsp. coracana TaxID=191504 RepID=A0AAV5FJJ8_ELECO|nr:hypothetical protein PR202_gb23689 [Eleusine coracana subsp. coracana]
MEVTPLSVGKSVLDGALGYTKSTIAEEVALQLGIASDHAFIRDELDMMRSFLMVAHEERNEQNKVLTTWVNQVRDVAYDTEDCLQDCSIHLHRPSWWRLPRTLGERRRIAKKMKELRAKVEDVSQRNLRYGLIKGSCSKPATAPAHSDMVSATMSAMEESWWQQDKAKEGLIQLTDNTDEDLRVIAVCGASGLLGETSIVRKAYNDLKGKDRFKCHAWVRIVHPFNQTEFLQNIIRQFYVDLLDEMAKVQNKSDPAIQSLLKTGRMKGDALLDGFINYLHGKSYLIVLADLSSMQEWDQIKACFPNNKKGSRLIVCTEHVEVASLCTVPETVLPNHKQLSTDQTLYVFYEKDLQDGTGATELGSATRANENSNISMDGKGHSQMDMMLASFQESQLIGRQNEKSNIIKLISKESQEFEVFNKSIDLSKHAELNEEAKLILKKCGGLPLAIVTIGGFLAKQPKTPVVWRKLKEHISAELEMHPELGMIRNVLIKSYDGLPYHLKACFLYIFIFREDHSIRRRRLVRRWIAEGYSREVRGRSQEDIADRYFMELIDRSMILPFQESIASRKEIDSCQVHDLMREISISKSTEENLVFRMGKGGNLNSTQYKVRHLVVSSNWAGDRGEYESAVDLSRIRSLTVFGKWRPFFISHKMRMLRVLDLEGTTGLVNHHLEHIGRLFHLKYLSLRGCAGIFHLPDSLGNLKQLQTLDVSGTSIIKLPKTIIKLRKLQFLRGGGSESPFYEPWEVLKEIVSTFCVRCWIPKPMRDKPETEVDMTRRDACTACCCVWFPFLGRQVDPSGVLLPRGVRKLKALHTLGAVNIARGKAILHDISKLSQLRKLEVTGVNKRNCVQLCLVFVHLSRLDSLSLQSLMMDEDLCGCLDTSCSPPKSLESLKLVIKLVELPRWIGDLQNLVKLKLEGTFLVRPSATIRVLGKLPKLSILCLSWCTFDCRDLRLNFHRVLLPSLVVLQLLWIDHDVRSVEFAGTTMPKLELLRFHSVTEEIGAGLISGLESLPSLKALELLDNRTCEEDFLEDVKAQLAKNANRPILKRCNI